MADEATTSKDEDVDSQAQDDVVQASDEAITNTPAELEKNKEAVEESEDSSQTSTEETEPEAEAKDNSEEAEIKEWAAKKNLPLDDPIKIAKMYRESEKALGKKGQQEGQLKTAVAEANTNSNSDEVQSLRNELSAVSFYITHPEAKQYETEMVAILDEKPWLVSDLEVVLDAAKGRSSTEAEKLVAERQAGKKEALETVARSERAAPPRASATTRETPKPVTDADIAKMSNEEYETWRKDNDPFLAPA